MRDSNIKTLQPHKNTFDNFLFHNQREYTTKTSAIPEDIIEQINKHSDELSLVHKLLYDIFINTGLWEKEVFFLETDCIESSHYEGISQLKFKPYKVLSARRRHGVGDYHRVMIPQSLADKISCHISDTVHLREVNKSPYIFLSQKSGYSKTIMRSKPFIKEVRNIIIKYNI